MGTNEVSKIVVVAHGKCYDGFGAAWVCKRMLPAAEIVFASYGEPVPEILATLQERDAVYLVDFSFPRDIMIELNSRVGFMRVLDHHKTAQANCLELDFCEFDMGRSGAGMAWDYFGPPRPRPKIVDYVEDRDLWRFKLPNSAEVHAFVASYPMEFGVWDVLDIRLESEFEECLIEGQAILRYDDQKVEEMCHEAQLVQVGEYTVPAVNCPVQFGSKVGHELLELYPDHAFAAYYCYGADGTERWGLRGRDSDDFDVSEVAKQFGGGGHKKASGFVKKGDSNREILRRN